MAKFAYRERGWKAAAISGKVIVPIGGAYPEAELQHATADALQRVQTLIEKEGMEPISEPSVEVQAHNSQSCLKNWPGFGFGGQYHEEDCGQDEYIVLVEMYANPPKEEN